MGLENGEKFGSTEDRTFVSRAVERRVETGIGVECAGGCGERISFKARTHPKQIIANVYEEGVWKATRFYHPECYEALGQPYGQVYTGTPPMTQQDHDSPEGLESIPNQ